MIYFELCNCLYKLCVVRANFVQAFADNLVPYEAVNQQLEWSKNSNIDSNELIQNVYAAKLPAYTRTKFPYDSLHALVVVLSHLQRVIINGQ